MTRTALWREFETGSSLVLRTLRITVVVLSLLLLFYSGVIDLTWPQQTVVGVVTVLIGIWIDRSSSSYLITLTLMFASCYSTFRYASWRITQVVHFLRECTHFAFCISVMYRLFGHCAVRRCLSQTI